MPGTSQWREQFGEHIQRYEFAAERTPAGGRVLDAGCGAGHGAACLEDRGAQLVVAVDIAAGAIETARANFDRPNIRWVQEDCHVLADAGRDAPFDIVCNLENLEHLSEPELFLARVTELLRPDGVLITSTPNRVAVNRLRGVPAEALTSNPYHFREYTAEEFRALLSIYFEHVKLTYQTLKPLERMMTKPALQALWQNPAVRVGRWLQRVIRRRPMADSLDLLLPPREYQLLSQDPGASLSITLLAECRGPRAARGPRGA